MTETSDLIWRRINASGEAPSARRYAHGGMFDGRLYVFGGTNVQKESLNDLHAFDVATRSWSAVAQTGDVPSVRHGAACAIHGGRMYLFGGASAKNKALDDFYAFEFASGTWTRINAAGGPSKRYFAASIVVADKLYVHGGEVNIKTQLNDFYEFSFKESSWRKLTPSNAVRERAGHMLFCNADDSRIFLYGVRVDS